MIPERSDSFVMQDPFFNKVGGGVTPNGADKKRESEAEEDGTETQREMPAERERKARQGENEKQTSGGERRWKTEEV